jgi:low affinity Fe/Cu permease
LLQRTQNQDTKAVNIKLDALLRAIEGARTGFVNLSTLTDEELDKREAELLNLGRRAGVGALPTSSIINCDYRLARGHRLDGVRFVPSPL